LLEAIVRDFGNTDYIGV